MLNRWKVTKEKNAWVFINKNTNNGHIQKIDIREFTEKQRIELYVYPGDVNTLIAVVMAGKKPIDDNKSTYFFDTSSIFGPFQGKTNTDVDSFFSNEAFVTDLNPPEQPLFNFYYYKNAEDRLDHIQKAFEMLALVDPDAQFLNDLVESNVPSLTNLCINFIGMFNKINTNNPLKTEDLHADLQTRLSNIPSS